MNSYDIGDQVRLSAQFTDVDGIAVDPTVITVKRRSPAGVETELMYGTDAAVVREETGAYYVDFVVSQAGLWAYRWESSGAVTAAAEGQFQVRRSAFS